MQSLRLFFCFLKELITKRESISELTKRDFKNGYLGSYLGLVWAFILPLANVFIFWFVFQIGFKSRPVSNFPFILWYMTGLIIWNFFNDSISSGMNAVTQYGFVVKKVSFSIGLLPVIKILSALLIHLFFIFVIIVLFMLYGQMPNLYYFQVVYYLVAAFLFALGMSWFTSAVVLFFRDLRQIISILLQFGFFLTPIFWSLNILPKNLQLYMKLNPVFYIIEGYRDCFINRIWFWEHWGMTIYFWGITTVVFILGAVVFRRLRPYFADVL